MNRQHRIVCAAIRLGDQVIAGVRHYDRIMRQQIEGSRNEDEWYGSQAMVEQGFLDNRHQFLDRKAALDVARQADQIDQKYGCPDELFSQDLY